MANIHCIPTADGALMEMTLESVAAETVSWQSTYIYGRSPGSNPPYQTEVCPRAKVCIRSSLDVSGQGTLEDVRLTQAPLSATEQPLLCLTAIVCARGTP